MVTDLTRPQIAFTVSGKVQGVFFRDSTEKRAAGMGITGFVSNARDGTVCVPLSMIFEKLSLTHRP